MQRVELDDFAHPLHCPFCGHKTVWEGGSSPCEHTLFIATDYGLDYCSGKIKKSALKKEAEESGWDGATDELDYDEYVKFALYLGGFGAYVGFGAPSEQ